MNYDAIFFIGPQGSGKGTQARGLASRLNFFYWEMGAILRAEAKLDNERGRYIAGLINQGQLVDDEHLYQVIGDQWPSVPKGQPIIFDGVPRRLNQGQWLLNKLRQEGYNQFATISIDVPREESVKRLLERAHHEFRVDDTPEKIRERLRLYEQHTVPVLDYLRQETDFFDIDGIGTVEEITQRINRALGV
jgi:adenylate kinase